MVSSSINPSGVCTGKGIFRVDEYIFFVFIGMAEVQAFRIPGLTVVRSDAPADDVTGMPRVRWAVPAAQRFRSKSRRVKAEVLSASSSTLSVP